MFFIDLKKNKRAKKLCFTNKNRNKNKNENNIIIIYKYKIKTNQNKINFKIKLKKSIKKIDQNSKIKEMERLVQKKIICLAKSSQQK